MCELERKLSELRIEFCQKYCSVTAQEIHIPNDKTGKKLRDVKKYRRKRQSWKERPNSPSG